MNTKTLVSIWLMFSQEDTFFLQSHIDRLANTYETDSFLPHVTLFVGEVGLNSLITLEDSIQDLAERTNVFTVTGNTVTYNEVFFKSVFQELETNSSLVALQQSIASIFAGQTYTFLPHISLLYSSISLNQKADIAQNERQTMRKKYTANSVAIILPAKGSDWMNVKGWRMVKQLYFFTQ